MEVIIPVLGDGCWVLSLYKTILLDEIMPCMWINLILLTIYTFNGRTLFLIPFYSPYPPSESVTKSHACLPVTLSSSYPAIPLSPVTHRTCSSVTLSFITINLSTCLLVNLSTYSLTLSSSYPVIPLSPVTHRTCSSVTLSFIAPRVFPCLLVDLSSALQSTICSHYVIMSFCLNTSFRHYV